MTWAALLIGLGLWVLAGAALALVGAWQTPGVGRRETPQ